MTTSQKPPPIASYPPAWNAAWDWHAGLAGQFAQAYFQKLSAFVALERRNYPVYPAAEDTFRAFRLTPLSKVRAVILGQDPYHGAGQAHGLSFSVPRGTAIPPSLQNVFSELASDFGVAPPGHGDLSNWAGQGVLLLNTVLTVRAGQPLSHRGQGWEEFSAAVIRQVSDACPFCVFLLWGKPAAAKAPLIESRHEVITAPHPSPLSAYRGFLGSRVFSRCNEALRRRGLKPIDWLN
jgi:uracil-DNA glycosylase